MKKVFLALVAAVSSLFCSAQTPAASTVQHPDWCRNAIIYEVNLRQFTPEGTINAFAAHLPRLKELGVDILWFMPIHPISELNRKGELGSYYAVRDYKAVNPEFGSLDDFRAVVAKAHSLGMKVIIDWVPNHSGCDNAWVTEHPDWYMRNEQGQMYGPYDWTDVYRFDYSVPAMRAAMIDALQFWLREADIDGFRCDVAGMVPVDFWNECRPALQSVKQSIFMLAEATEPELTQHCFDMAYNWPMKDLFSAIAATAGYYTFANDKGEIRTFDPAHAADIYTRLNEEQTIYPAGAILMNMITNHDLNSWEGTEFQRLGQLQRAFAVLTYTLPGMPLIYTGQEVGLDRAFEFFVKDTAPDWNANPDTFNFYRTLCTLRHQRPELAAFNGAKVEPIATTTPDVLAFRRGNIITVVNLGNTTVAPFATSPDLTGYTELFGATDPTAPLTPGAYQIWTK